MKEWNQSKEKNILGFCASSPPRSLLEKWRGQWGVQQTTAKLANLSLMFAALSSAEFQGNGFSAAEHKRVSPEKTFHFGTKLFEVFCDNGKALGTHDRGLPCCQKLKNSKMLWFGPAQKVFFVLFSTWQERICQHVAKKIALAWSLGKNEPDHWNGCEIVS